MVSSCAPAAAQAQQRSPTTMDKFTIGIIVSILLGLLLPCSGAVGVGFGWVTHAAIILLFYLYGVKLSRRAVWEGIMHWRLQSMVVFFTFAFFPLITWLSRPALEPLVGAALFGGLLYVACLPSTVQSSIAFTSVAGGNVPAAVCSASISSLLGVFFTPMLAGLFFTTSGAGSAHVGLDSILTISYQILLPFALGQLTQRRLKPWVDSHRSLISLNDRLTIWLVVYTSFSSATVQGYWQRLDSLHLAGLIAACIILLAAIQLTIYAACKLLHFNRPDSITILFCGSKKSLAVGAPMMLALFGGLDNNLLLPLMVFHQVQLMLCAHLAARWKKAASPERLQP